MQTDRLTRLKRMRNMSLVLFLTSLPAAVFARSMGGQVSANAVFDMIFGVDPTSLVTIVTGTQGTLVSQVSSVICIVAMFSAVFLMMLTFFVGLAQTAHDGSVLGQRYSSMWVPLRSVIGLGFLTPLVGGYSLLQAVVLWIGTLGSGFADQGWQGGLPLLAQRDAPTVTMSHKSHRSLVNEVFTASVCAARINMVAAEARQTGSAAPGVQMIRVPMEQIVVRSPSAITTGGGNADAPPRFLLRGGLRYDGTDGIAQSKAVCGEILLEQPMEMRGVLVSAIRNSMLTQVNDLHDLGEGLGILAERMVTQSMPITEVRRELRRIEGIYAGAESRRLRAYAQEAAAQMPAMKAIALQRASNGGWINAGAYYMTMARSANAVHDAANATSMSTGLRQGQMPASTREDLAPYLGAARNATAAGGTGRIDGAAAAAGVTASGAGDVPDEMSTWDMMSMLRQPGAGGKISEELLNRALNEIGAKIDEKTKPLVQDMQYTLMGQPGQDPVVAMSQFGHRGMGWIYGLGGALLLIVTVLAATFVGLGAAMAVLTTAIPLMTALFVPLSLLAYYLPLIPYIYWTFGVLAWVLLLVEAVAIAPMWAAAHVMPEGEGLAGTHAKQGWMLMVSLLLRPILMVMGFAAAMSVMRFMSLFVGTTFGLVFDNNMPEGALGTMGPVSICAYLVAVTGIMIAAAKATFSLIYEVPNRALRYLSGGESLGDFGGLETARSVGSTLGGATAGAVGGMIAGSRGALGKSGSGLRSGVLRRLAQAKTGGGAATPG